MTDIHKDAIQVLPNPVVIKIETICPYCDHKITMIGEGDSCSKVFTFKSEKEKQNEPK